MMSCSFVGIWGCAGRKRASASPEVAHVAKTSRSSRLVISKTRQRISIGDVFVSANCLQWIPAIRGHATTRLAGGVCGLRVRVVCRGQEPVLHENLTCALAGEAANGFTIENATQGPRVARGFDRELARGGCIEFPWRRLHDPNMNPPTRLGTTRSVRRQSCPRHTPWNYATGKRKTEARRALHARSCGHPPGVRRDLRLRMGPDAMGRALARRSLTRQGSRRLLQRGGSPP